MAHAMNRYAALLVCKIVAVWIVSTALFAAPRDSLIRIERLSPAEILLLTNAQSVRFREDVSAPANQVRLELSAISPADSIRELIFPSGTAWNAAYVRQRTSGSLVILESAQPSGHVIAELPYSHAIYIRRVNWDNAAECALAWGMLAWSNQQYHRAVLLWQRALSLGSPDATLWLGIAEALQQRYANALAYLEPALARNDVNLPDVYAAVSLAYRVQGDTMRSSLYYRRYIAVTGRQLSPPPLLHVENNLSPSHSFSLFDIADRFSPPPAPTVDSSPTVHQAEHNDVFIQLRQFQQRRQDTVTATESASPARVPIFLLVTGITLLMLGTVLIIGYRRWRNYRIQQLAAAINSTITSHVAPPATTFDEIMKIVAADQSSLLTEIPSDQAEDDTIPSPTEHATITIEKDDDSRAEGNDRKSRPLGKFDERLFYQSDLDFQLSQESPEQTAPELSAQERDLLRILEQLSRESSTKHSDKT